MGNGNPFDADSVARLKQFEQSVDGFVKQFNRVEIAQSSTVLEAGSNIYLHTQIVSVVGHDQ
jgi:hypothetical protein